MDELNHYEILIPPGAHLRFLKRRSNPFKLPLLVFVPENHFKWTGPGDNGVYGLIVQLVELKELHKTYRLNTGQSPCERSAWILKWHNLFGGSGDDDW